nr:heparinase II/III family protein [Clostridia bacterium]
MLLQKAKDPAFWSKVRTSPAYRPLLDNLLELWNTECQGDIAACKFSDFILFDTTGNRTEYENPYHMRRRILNASAMLSLIYPEEEKYFTKLCDAVWSILDEYSWVLPAHIGNFKTVEESEIDLGAAITGSTLAELDHVFGDRLPSLIRSRIAHEIDRRIIDNYMKEPRYFWESTVNNWAAVCMGNVGCAIIYRKPELAKELIPRMTATMDGFLSGYTDEGICMEGLGYWNYGFEYYVVFADLLYSLTDGETDLFDRPKIREIVKFPSRVCLGGNAVVSFSDCNTEARCNRGLLHFLKSKFPGEVRLPPSELMTGTSPNCFMLYLRSFLWYDESLESEEGDAESTYYASGAQWLIKRSKNYGFAAKAGCNMEQHNQNDVGSFIVAVDGHQVLCDPGKPTYCRQYFSKERYSFFEASSRGHSVPIIGGKYQQACHDKCRNVSFDGEAFTFDMSPVYKIEELSELTRRFTFTDSSVTLHDRYAFEGNSDGEAEGNALPVTERFVSLYPAETEADRLTVRTGGLTLKADNAASVSISEDNGRWCIDYELKAGQEEFTLTIEL